MIPILFFQCSADHRDLHSFPTRRSSDLWHHWGCDWHHHYAVHDHGRYYSTSRTFYNRDKFYRGEAKRGMYIRPERDRKSTRLNSSHVEISYAVFCLKKKKKMNSKSLGST